MSEAVTQARWCRERGQWVQAERWLREALARSPELAAAHLELGNLLKSRGRYREALTSLCEAVRLAPQAAAGWLNRGVAHLELNEREAAIACFRAALALEPNRPEAHNILGHALAQAGQSSAAATHLTEALRLKPRYAAAHDNLGRVLKLQGRAALALEHHRTALAEVPKLSTASNLLYTLNLLDLPPEHIFAEHRRLGLAWSAAQGETGGLAAEPAVAALPPGSSAPLAGGAAAPAPAGPRLRLGYVSPDFCHHAVAYFFEPVLDHHDRERYEVFCYSSVKTPDRTTARLRSKAEHWREAAGLDDQALCDLVRADRIDVLIDLAGHTAGNRLGAFARRAAPVQFTWLGYPNTTGLSAMDYRITDAVADPAGNERWHSERLVRLDGPFSCYLPPDDCPAVVPPPSVGAGGPVTFGCFNHIAKWNEPLIHLWASVLQAVPRSRLKLKSRGLGDEPTVRRIARQFGAAGVDPARVDFLGAELSVRDHLALYGQIDIALDAYPYNGTTTTCEALWMGVPVVTLCGRTHVARVGASLLTSAGCPEGIAHDRDQYVRIAREWASSPDELAEKRQAQRPRMALSPLCQGREFTRRLEAALRVAHTEKLAGRQAALTGA